MITVKAFLRSRTLELGRTGENNATTIEFDVSNFQKSYGDGTAVLLHQRPEDDAPYLVGVTQEDNIVSWLVTSADTAQTGQTVRTAFLQR